MRKSLAFVFSFLLIFANLAFVQPSESFAKALDQAVTISVLDANGEDIVALKAVEIEDGTTALDVLEEVAEVEKEDRSWGPMITGINGHTPEWEDNESYWQVIRNGVAAQVGAHELKVKDADNLLFLYRNKDHGELNVQVTIEDAISTVKLEPFSTAYDAIQQAAKDQGKQLDIGIDDTYFAFVNNIGNKELADNEFWSFFINDELASVGVSKTRLKQDDHVSFKVDTFDLPEEETPEEDSTEEDSTEETEDEAANEVEDNDKETDKDESNEQKENDQVEKEEKTNKDIQAINKLVTKDLTALKKIIKDNNLLSSYGTEPYVWAYAKAGGKVPTAYRDDIAKELADEDTNLNTTNEMAKVVIALSVAGFDATDLDGKNLVEMLAQREDLLTTHSVMTQAYVLNALNLAEYDADQQLKEKLVTSILDKQMTSGGWGFFGDTPSADVTGMVLDALAPYKSDETVNDAAQQAIDYLANDFDGTGWFYDKWSGGYTSEAISQVIVGLSSYGVNPTEAPFIDDKGKGLLSYLLDFRTDNSMYKHTLDADGPDIGFATSQAFLALAYYQDSFMKETPVVDDEEDKEEASDNPENDVEEDPEEDPQEDPQKEAKEKDENQSLIVEGTQGGDDASVETVEVGSSTTDALPQTNSNIFNYIAYGLILVTIGVVVMVLRRKWSA